MSYDNASTIFTPIGAPLRVADAAEFQKSSGLCIPREYVDFLAVCNGGRAREDLVAHGAGLDIDFMLGTDRSRAENIYDSLVQFREDTGEHLAYRTLIPIGGQYIKKWICLAARSPNRGAVWIVKTPYMEKVSAERVAPSFAVFWESITTTALSDDGSFKIYLLGKELYSQGRYADAIVEFQRSWNIAQNAGTAYWIAQSFRGLNQLAEATVWFLRCLDINPRNNSYCIGYAQHLVDIGRLPEARELIERMLLRTPTFGPAIRLRDILIKTT